MPEPTPAAHPLSLFESKRVTETTVKCAGTITHVYGKPARELRHGEVLVAVVVVEVDKVSFPRADDGLVREQTLKVQELFELELPEFEKLKLLSDLRAKVRRAVEARYVEEPADDGAESGAA